MYLAILCNFAVLSRSLVPVCTQGFSPSHITQENASSFGIHSVFVFFSAGSVLSLFPVPTLPRAGPVSISMPVFQDVSLGLFSFPRPISYASFFSAASAQVPLHLCMSLFLSAEEDEGKIEVLNGRVGSPHWMWLLDRVCFHCYWAPAVPVCRIHMLGSEGVGTRSLWLMDDGGIHKSCCGFPQCKYLSLMNTMWVFTVKGSH